MHDRPVEFSAVQCRAVKCSSVQCSAVQCSAVQCSATKEFSAFQCSAFKVFQCEVEFVRILELCWEFEPWVKQTGEEVLAIGRKQAQCKLTV